jgi:hypothetical protein
MRIAAISPMRVPTTRRPTYASTEALALSSQFTSSTTTRSGSTKATAVRSRSVAIATACSSEVVPSTRPRDTSSARRSVLVSSPNRPRTGPRSWLSTSKLSAASNSAPVERSTRVPARLASAATHLAALSCRLRHRRSAGGHHHPRSPPPRNPAEPRGRVHARRVPGVR